MHIGIVGLGRMGANIARRLAAGGVSVEQGVPAPVLTLALMARFASQGNADYTNKLLAKMRNSFSGHRVEKNTP